MLLTTKIWTLISPLFNKNSSEAVLKNLFDIIIYITFYGSNVLLFLIDTQNLILLIDR